MDDISLCSQPVSTTVSRIEYIKLKLQEEVKKLHRCELKGKPWNTISKDTMEILNDLDEMSVTIPDLRVTKIGKILTKYEKELPLELARICVKINVKWKEQLQIYRQEIKDQLNSNGPEKQIQITKEDPCSKNQNAEVNHASNAPINQKKVLTARGAANLNAIVQQNFARSVTTKFILEMKSTVEQTLSQVSNVEKECNVIRNTMNDIANKLLLFEKNVDYFVSSMLKGQNQTTLQNDISEGKQKHQETLNNGIDRDNYQLINVKVINRSENDNTTISNESASLLLSNDQNINTPVVSNSNDLHKCVQSTSINLPSCTNMYTPSHSDAAQLDVHSPSHTENEPRHQYEENNTLGNIFDNICITASQVITPTNKKTSLKRTSVQQTDIPINNKTTTIIIKEEITDENCEKEHKKAKISVIPDFGCSSSKSLTNTSIQHSLKKSESVSQKKKTQWCLPSLSTMEKREGGQQGIAFARRTPKSPKASGVLAEPFHQIKTDTSSSNSRGINNAQIISKDDMLDDTGFKVPTQIVHTTLHPKGNNATLIIKGEPVDQDSTQTNFDDIELDTFLSYSQAVDDMEDDINETEKDYLLQNKRKNRTSWNHYCKRKEGVKYAPLTKTNGRMKAVHKSSVGKEGIQSILRRRSNEK